MDFFKKDPDLESELKKRGKLDCLADMAYYDNIKFSHVYQDEQLGDGHAILQAKDWVTSDQVAVLFGDDLIIGEKTGLQQLAEHCADGAMLCLEDVPKEKVSSYGIVDAEPTNDRLKTIKELIEKPSPEEAPSTLGIVGKYIVPRSLFDVLPNVAAGKGGEIRIIDALTAQLGKMPIHGYVCEGKRYDTGTPEGYKEAVTELG